MVAFDKSRACFMVSPGSLRLIVSAAGILALCHFTACGERASEEAPIGDAEAVSYGREMIEEGAPQRSESSVGEYLVAWQQPGFVQRYGGVNFNSLRVIDEVERASGEWESLVHQGSATFFVWRTKAAGLDEYALIGSARDGDVVIELWTLVGEDGNVVHHGELGATIPSSELEPKRFSKRRIVEGFTGYSAVDVDVDPDLRFVVFLVTAPDGAVEFYQLDLEDPAGAPLMLAESGSIPELGSALRVQRFDHVTLGRVYRVETSRDLDKVILFVDLDNNGQFDGGPLVESYYDRPYSEWSTVDG